jgi:hypothetical protein
MAASIKVDANVVILLTGWLSSLQINHPFHTIIDDAEYPEGVIRRGTVNLRCARGKTVSRLKAAVTPVRPPIGAAQRPRCRFERLIP